MNVVQTHNLLFVSRELCRCATDKVILFFCMYKNLKKLLYVSRQSFDDQAHQFDESKFRLTVDGWLDNEGGKLSKKKRPRGFVSMKGVKIAFLNQKQKTAANFVARVGSSEQFYPF